MEPDDDQDHQNVEALAPSPRLRDYIWRPRFSKAWWTASCAHWSGMALAFEVRPLADYYNTTFAGFVGVLLYPPLMLAVCGALLLRAKLFCGEWQFTETPRHVRFPELSDGGLRDPYTDPLDPRSGPMHLRHIGVLKD